ncbi:MAG TPA: hypothetical protein VE242_04595, partial [Chthoniobacterales bacterium]|nr:hypothetical protein [Chthoniobacterales bacterium]
DSTENGIGLSQLLETMQLTIPMVTAISPALNRTAPAENYDTLAANGERWGASYGGLLVRPTSHY